MKIKNIELEVIQGDITDLQVDAIVNAANNDFTMTDGLAGFIKMKGGLVIEEEALLKGPVEMGEAIWTEGGHLSAKYVIHAVTMSGLQQPGQEHIRSAVANSLRIAKKLKCKSLALPALGCGAGGFSPAGAARIITQEIIKAAGDTQSKLELIQICLFDKKTFSFFNKTITSYLDHLREDLGWGPYSTVDIIIEMKEGIILIERSNPPYGWALPGGFLDPGESLEEAAVRETKEETSMDLKGLRQLHTYSAPGRDPRFQTISTVFIAKGEGKPQFGDDAKGLKVVKYDELLKLDYAFDHKDVIKDYLKQRKK